MELKSALFFLASISLVQAYAQSGSDTSVNKTLQIVNEYKPKFIDAQKIESVPVIDKPVVKPVTFTYQIKSHQVNTAKIVNPIPMADIEMKQNEIYPNSFVKLGYGNLKTPLAEIYLNNKQNNKYSY